MSKIGDRAFTGWCDCADQPTQLRVMHDAAGRPHYKRQCLRCGRSVGNAIAKHAVKNPEDVQAFDQTLRVRMELLAQFNRDSATSETYAARQDEYRRYLNSPEWAEKRAVVLKRAGQIGLSEETLASNAGFRVS